MITLEQKDSIEVLRRLLDSGTLTGEQICRAEYLLAKYSTNQPEPQTQIPILEIMG